MNSMIEGADERPEDSLGPATRAAGLARLAAFAPKMGRSYRDHRNYDRGPGRHTAVSQLSPWIRRRLIREEEALAAALAAHSPAAAEKFIQEVFWRGYFKGWLEHRPSVWTDYTVERDDALASIGASAAQSARLAEAVAGRTGIDGFDFWARELVETGYLHNHARMWFASIWIFTLELPWQLGADFFLRHLLDADPASNTLSWRWVAGLHTRGKTYQARASNIAKYTEGRFKPEYQLSPVAEPLEAAAPPPPEPVDIGDRLEAGERFVLLGTDDDGALELSFRGRRPVAVGVMSSMDRLSPGAIGAPAAAFTAAAMADTLDRASAHFEAPGAAFGLSPAPQAVLDWAAAAGAQTIAAPFPTVGPVRDAVDALERAATAAGMRVKRIKSAYDAAVWPHATKGFFALKAKIPRILAEIGADAPLLRGVGGA